MVIGDTVRAVWCIEELGYGLTAETCGWVNQLCKGAERQGNVNPIATKEAAVVTAGEMMKFC